MQRHRMEMMVPTEQINAFHSDISNQNRFNPLGGVDAAGACMIRHCLAMSKQLSLRVPQSREHVLSIT